MAKTSYKRVFTSNLEPVLVVNADSGRISAVNGKASRLLEANANELIEKPFASLIPGREGALSRFLRAVNAFGLKKSESILLPSNKPPKRILELFGSRMSINRGWEVAVMLVDVTARHKTFSESIKDQHRIEAARVRGQFGRWERDLETGQGHWSREVFRLFGLKANKDAPSYVELAKYIEPNDFDRLKKSMERFRKWTKPVDLILRIKRPDGERKILRTYYKVIRDEHSGRRKMVGTIHEVTHQIKYVEEIKDREEMLSLINEIERSVVRGALHYKVIEKAIKHVQNMFPQYRAVYGLISSDLIFSASNSKEPEGMKKMAGLKLDLNKIPEFVDELRSGQVASYDIETSPKFLPVKKELKEYQSQAILSTPLTCFNELIGMFCLDCSEPHRWTEHEKMSMIELGRFLSFSLTNARLILEKEAAEKRLQLISQELESEHRTIDEKNIALKQILEHMEKEKASYRHQFSESVRNLLSPMVNRLKFNEEYVQAKDIEHLEQALDAITRNGLDEFSKNLDSLTPREIEICGLIRQGKSSKEISRKLNLSPLTIHKHRESIRRKLSLKNKRINLNSFLRSHPPDKRNK